ncbi:MAG: aminotransferase class I/II-fold pyridoxal phosphate-dependent enzyme [Pirellulales bacterium]|nr:aminotransferase class I/II-fold pyridoxal phosphate-dependent enzyme [Pirellulales bacterium]
MPVMQSPPGPRTVIDGREYLYFGGTAYLGLQRHPEVIRAACEAAERYGIGSATSRTGYGDTPPTLDVERQAACFLGAEAALYFASGYQGGHILVSAGRGLFDAVFVDELSHYCVLEAARLSGLPFFPFQHADPEDLRAALGANLKPGQRPLVMSDGVFSALGHIAPVAEYCRVLRHYAGAALVIDDAHGIGVLGEHGRGTTEHSGMPDPINLGLSADEFSEPPALLVYGTCSKALGGFGGIIPGSQRFIAQLKQTHYYAGASAPPVPAAAATGRALEILQADPAIRLRLHENVRAARAGLRRLGLTVDDSPVPIVCLRIGSADRMRRIHEELLDRGILVPYMAAYSGLGPEGALRLAVFADHSGEMIEQLLDALARLL